MAAPPGDVWRALNDPATLKAAIPGCESIEPDGEDAFRLAMLVRVGPLSAQFTGKAQLFDIDAPHAYSIRYEGSAAAAGFVKGEARITLAPAGADATVLDFRAKAQVGGKLAQIGSRLIDAAATKVVADFFTRFVVAATVGSLLPDDARRLSRARRWWAAFVARFRARAR